MQPQTDTPRCRVFLKVSTIDTMNLVFESGTLGYRGVKYVQFFAKKKMEDLHGLSHIFKLHFTIV